MPMPTTAKMMWKPRDMAICDRAARRSVTGPPVARPAARERKWGRRDGLTTAAASRTKTTLRQGLPEQTVVDFAVVPPGHVHAAMGHAQLCSCLRVGGGQTRPARIRPSARLAHRGHADPGGAGGRTGRGKHSEQAQKRDLPERHSRLHTFLPVGEGEVNRNPVVVTGVGHRRAARTGNFRKSSGATKSRASGPTVTTRRAWCAKSAIPES